MISGGYNTVGNKRGIDPKCRLGGADLRLAGVPLGGGEKGPALRNLVSPRSVPPGVPVGGVGWVSGIVSGVYGAYSEGTRLKIQRVLN